MHNRLYRSASASLNGMFGVVFKTLVTSVVFGACVVAVMHYMGVPVPSLYRLLRDVARMIS
jgi:hypothetical protein